MVTFVFDKKEKFTYDFELEVSNAVDFLNWFYNSTEYSIQFQSDFRKIDRSNSIPVGSIEFVHRFYKEVWGVNNLPPINIPPELISFAKRKVWYGTEKEEIKATLFCKSADKIKGYTGIVNHQTVLERGNYMFSELIDIDSEWRCFVLNGELLGIHNYNNSLGLTPDITLIKEMVKTYNKLDAFTLDVGVNRNDTFIIEVHDFYSCGLYGFRNYNKLIQMIIASHRQKIFD